jgi:membrane-associated phospholipid phosphatase
MTSPDDVGTVCRTSSEPSFSPTRCCRVLSLGLLLCALVLAFIGLFEWDVPLTRFIRSLSLAQTDNLANPWLARLSNIGDRLGKGESLVVISLAIWAVGFVLKQSVWKAAGWQSLLAHGIAGVVNNLTKHLVGRARPKFMHAGTLELSPVSGSGWDSFPSGHSTASFAVAAVLAVKFPKFRYAIWFLASAIAVSRIVRGSHYLTDVAGGALLGCLIGSLAANRWRDWRTSLESALYALTPFLAALLAILWTIGQHPSSLWLAPQLIGGGAIVIFLGLAGDVLLVIRPDVLPAFFTRHFARSLIGFGIGMFTGSVLVSVTVLLVCIAWWLRPEVREEGAVPCRRIPWLREVAFGFAVLLALYAMTELRGALPML